MDILCSQITCRSFNFSKDIFLTNDKLPAYPVFFTRDPFFYNFFTIKNLKGCTCKFISSDIGFLYVNLCRCIFHFYFRSCTIRSYFKGNILCFQITCRSRNLTKDILFVRYEICHYIRFTCGCPGNHLIHCLTIQNFQLSASNLFRTRQFNFGNFYSGGNVLDNRITITIFRSSGIACVFQCLIFNLFYTVLNRPSISHLIKIFPGSSPDFS